MIDLLANAKGPRKESEPEQSMTPNRKTTCISKMRQQSVNGDCVAAAERIPNPDLITEKGKELGNLASRKRGKWRIFITATGAVASTDGTPGMEFVWRMECRQPHHRRLVEFFCYIDLAASLLG
ncbi:hypothetical protein HNY73_000673 [Argiope bruennichi]|uniref:Uncharacterized protein n=1 Tax=Argiope bruennichi TaxID=94029 RepID=A0A8T0FYT8_ARGBR|nr:hypothetical protein HNY73_000673 [Argiope bruennichi]